MSSFVSAVIITLNEEAVIADCIRTAQRVADEVLVLDSYSTDSTKDICEQMNVRFIQREWQGYSETKNHANNLASHDFILSLDADETLDNEAIDQILAEKQKGLSGAYSFNRKNFYGTKWIRYCGWYPDTKVRLFDRRLAEWKGSFVHEELDIRAEPITHLSGNILHNTVRDQAHHMETVKKYAKLAAQQAQKDGKTLSAVSSVFSAFGRFIKIYVFKLGFLHGLTGFYIARNSARSRWLRYQYFKSQT